MDTPLAVQHHEKNLELERITKIKPEPLQTSAPWHFRDKVKLTVSGSVEAPVIGLLQDNLRETVELLDCPVQAQALNETLPMLKAFITRWKLTPYDVLERKGELKGIILSHSPENREMMVRFVLRSREALDRIRQGLGELSVFKVVSVNLQPIPHAILEGPEEIILTQEKTILHNIGQAQVCFSPQSFMQTNSAVASALYQAAVAWLTPWKGERVLDLFCGVGGFSLSLAREGFQVHGVEINPAAIINAQAMAQTQKLEATFSAKAAEDVSELWNDWQPRVVVVNPPRRGLAASMALLEHHQPAVLLYSSCSPKSLADDLTQLERYYFAERTKIFDMFPYTHHFESLTLLVRR
jgi:23S rRNA (uracil747-C5)-methyltransferase